VITLSSEKKFRAKTPYIKKASYNVVMHSPRMAENSVKIIKKMFKEGSLSEKKQLIRMLQLAGAISMNNARNSRQYTRKDREKFHEVAVMYKSLRRDLDNLIKEE
jgi:Holliday junction resolvase RusA-like endonuclease